MKEIASKIKDPINILREGNSAYIGQDSNPGDISKAIRKETAENGQHPYAVVVTCADSRVIPEAIFNAGIGEIFTIRVAGNVLGDHALGSIEYAVGHLGSKLVVILGHEGCGAVDAAINGGAEGFINTITDEIKKAIGKETDPKKASCMNVTRSVVKAREAIGESAEVVGAVYAIDTGKVAFLDV